MPTILSVKSGGDGVKKQVKQTSHGFVIGDAVRHNGTIYVKAQADTETNAEVVGIVTANIDTNTFELTSDGFIEGLSGLVAGTNYYLSGTTAGALTSTAPLISKPLLLAVSTTSGYFVNFRGVTNDTSGGGGSASGSGIVREFTQTAHGFALGDVLRHNGTAFVKALADTVVNAEVVGMVTSVPDADTFKLSMGGYIEGLSGLVSGTVYFLSDIVAGTMTDAEPTISKPILISDSATSGILVNYRGSEAIDAFGKFEIVYNSSTDSLDFNYNG